MPLPIVEFGFDEVDGSGDIRISCPSGATTIVRTITAAKRAEYDSRTFDWKEEQPEVARLQEMIGEISRHGRAWQTLGYAGLMGLPWASALLDALPLPETGLAPPKAEPTAFIPRHIMKEVMGKPCLYYRPAPKVHSEDAARRKIYLYCYWQIKEQIPKQYMTVMDGRGGTANESRSLPTTR
jgi:hypothetical protein